ncbi:50S ribosome-binding GTPase, partial [Candidatus Peregrinibacteria bacterium]|nr:50S ribosome-binding GTPase [Candidatus Peregrinibacteria bacterium]
MNAKAPKKDGLPIVAIVGRPNVGKSSLFNRLIHKRYAITSPVAGTTRDRIYYRAELNDLTVVLVDTGGLEYGKKLNIEADVQTQVNVAIKEADLIFFLVDVKDGLTIEDQKAAQILRKAKKKIIFVANKIDHKESTHNIPETMKLGFGEPITMSAYHNINVEELIDTAEEILKEQGWSPISKADQEKQQDTINVCFLGKPNVGKSSLVNALLGKEKVIV